MCYFSDANNPAAVCWRLRMLFEVSCATTSTPARRYLIAACGSRDHHLEIAYTPATSQRGRSIMRSTPPRKGDTICRTSCAARWTTMTGLSTRATATFNPRPCQTNHGMQARRRRTVYNACRICFQLLVSQGTCILACGFRTPKKGRGRKVVMLACSSQIEQHDPQQPLN